jgi:uncharacterized membrane protein
VALRSGSRADRGRRRDRRAAAGRHEAFMGSGRAESFSDGVFAVAITVLVFNLLPIGAGKLDAGLLARAWPEYFAYVVSFLTIGIMWMNHHTMLSRISLVDRPLLVLNLILLMGVVAIPFPTALVAEHLTGRGASGGRAAAVSYGLVMIAISIGYAGMWVYLAAHQQRLGARRPVRTPRVSTLRFTAGLGGYVVGTLVAAFVSAVAGLTVYGLLAVYYLFEHLPDPGGTQQDGETGGSAAA